MLTNPSLGWQKLQNVYYSIKTCYDSVQWPIDNLYSNFRVAVSTHTTLLALAAKGSSYPHVIDIYTLSGNKVWSLVYNSSPSDHIVDFCFYNEQLLVILANRKYRLYTDFQGSFNEYSYTDDLVKLNSESENGDSDAPRYVITNLETNQTEEPFSVIEAQNWGRFLVLRYRNRITVSDLHSFTNYDIQFPSGLNQSKIHTMALVSITDSKFECLLSYDTTVFLVSVDLLEEAYSFVDQGLTDGPFSLVAASPDGAIIALHNPTRSRIFVITKTFDRILLEYDTSNESSAPYMMEWAGNDAIILSLRDEIKLIGPGQKSISFFYDIIEQDDFDIGAILNESTDNDLSFTIPVIKSEKDGLKIITGNKVEFLSRIPECCINLHLMGSSHPSSILLDCIDKLALQPSKAYTNISFLNTENSLSAAMDGCLQAALHEFSPAWQKKILKAVSFGKIYEEKYFDSDKYLRVLDTVKVLNQIRSPEIGLFLTNAEIEQMGWNTIVEMLVNRSQYLLALKIVDLLQLEDSRSLVYVHWCCSKIKKELNMSDINLFKIISKKLMSSHNQNRANPNRNIISVSEISKVAYEEGRSDLCKLLINLEPSTIRRVNQLLQIEEIELAMIKCFQSSEFDLCRLILMYLKDKLSIAQFFQVLNQNEQKSIVKDISLEEFSEDEQINALFQENLFINGDLIGNFWEQNIGKYSPKSLDAFLKHQNKTLARNEVKLKNYLQESSISQGESFEKLYQTQKTKLQSLLGNRKFSKQLHLELEVLELKKRLSETYQQSFFERKSVAEIIIKLIEMHQLKPVSKIVKDFKFSQEKYWNLVLEVYCKAGDFDSLHRFITASNPNPSASLKSPIGFEVIAETCLVYGAPHKLISSYIEQCTESHYLKRIDLYLQNGDYSPAAEEAFKNKDGDALVKIRKTAQLHNDDSLELIAGYLSRLGYGG
ncbi:hypothetical protein CLUG_01417 [Clavispora lusitaniae ATCC 42720]|uniref:Probable vacuolar protein sorting-associated protein 16 homolog n=1 Tax=Clavispora lusitaniae (strain ATCC 42720) TaxID=306902 RepID=C4XZN5_CLAL4|nr:uncharacterized protein CLUG_01417 [Clavispora lusitaniae ATCC 42720]EEQ37294.1 hypothetical protein CLUG_01417 [Clavispora lusitaniae ATCC 42720]